MDGYVQSSNTQEANEGFGSMHTKRAESDFI